MALQRSLGTSSLMNAVRKAEDQRLVGKESKMVGGKDGQRVTRAALRNLSNVNNQIRHDTSKVQIQKPVGKEPSKLPVQKVRKPLQSKENAQKEQITTAAVKTTTQLTDIKKEDSRLPECKVVLEQVKAEEKAEAVEEMDVTSPSAAVVESEVAFSRQMFKLNIHDIDQHDSDNPQLVSEYVSDIYEYLRELEERFSVREKCLANQTEITGRMRGILVDWLVQVHMRFQLLQETLYLTISILDRYCQVADVAKSKLQLVGVTCMWIASKYEEMYAPEIADFVYITDNAYTVQQMRTMECMILKALDFEIGRPIPIHFLRRCSKAAEADATLHTLAKYLMELTVVEYDMVHMKPSEIAAAALCLSLHLFCHSTSSWTDTLVYYSHYTAKQLEPVVRKIASLALTAGTGKLVAIKSKYQSSKFLRIAKSSVMDTTLLKQISAESSC